eukprot:m51a1_g10660 hypothetical protein (425) ;mRNA; r:47805-52249
MVCIKDTPCKTPTKKHRDKPKDKNKGCTGLIITVIPPPPQLDEDLDIMPLRKAAAAAAAAPRVSGGEQSEEEVVVVERKREEEEEDEDKDEDEEVSADDYKGTSRALQSDEDQRRALQEKQQISALMKKSCNLLAIFTAKPSEERAHQPCTFGEVRAGFKAMQMLLASTLSDLIMRMNALTCTVEAGMQSRELTLREKLMLGIPVPELENLPPDRGPYTAALSVIMARLITLQIQQWTKVNYHSLFMEHPEWSSVYWAYVEDEWTLVVLLNLIIPVNTSMKKQLNCLVLNLAFSVAGMQKKNPCFYIDYILRNCLLVPAQQQDQIIKGLEAARAKLKEKIATYKKEQVRVTNKLHEQHVLIAMLKSQNEGIKKQLELLKSEHAKWREYESLKGTSTTPSKHKVPTSHPAHPAYGSADGADTPTC